MTKKEKRRIIYRYIFWGILDRFFACCYQSVICIMSTSDVRVYDKQF